MSHQPKSSNKQNKNPPNDGLNMMNESIKEHKPKTYFNRTYDNLQSDSQLRLYSFGSNEMGQLGQGVPLKTSYNALLVPYISNLDIISFSAGDGHSICVSKEGLVYSWGAGACGQLGIDNNNNLCLDSEGYPIQPFPKQITLLNGIKIIKVACGDAHTLALTNDGQIYSWGGSGCGQLGHPDISEMPKDADNCPYLPYPQLIKDIVSEKMKNIACGKAHSLSIDKNGGIFTWGAGASGQLGVKELNLLPLDEDGYPYQPVPKCLKHLKNNIFIMGVCGDVHTIILNDKGEVFSFGGGTFGQLGQGPINRLPLDTDQYPYMPIPKKIEYLSHKKIVFIASGDSHSMAIDSEGKLYAWGTASCGQLGLDTINTMPRDPENNPYQPEPSQVTALDAMKVIAVSCGEIHSLVLIKGGVLLSFGFNSCGQLGFEKEESKQLGSSIGNKLNPKIISKPKLLTALFPYNISQIACGGVHSIISVEKPNNSDYFLFKLLKKEVLTDYILICNSKDILSIKCHKYILISRSQYFYNKIINNIDKEENASIELIIKEISNPIYFKTIIEYIYLRDSSFISLRVISEKDLLEYLKLAKLFELHDLEKKIIKVIKEKFSEYSKALKLIHEKTENNYSNLFNGLFFLPNGSSFILLNDKLVNKVMEQSIKIPLDQESNDQQMQMSGINQLKTSIDELQNKIILTEVNENSNLSSVPSPLSLYEEITKNNLTYETLKKFNIEMKDCGDSIKLFNQKITSDITIKVSNGIFYANKLVLGCASKFFEMLLTENMKENQANEIIINDYLAEDFVLILLLFYFEDNIRYDLKTNLEMLKEFDMLQVNQYLKSKIEAEIAVNMSIDTVTQIYTYASLYNYDRLTRLSLLYIQDNYISVVNSKQFEELQRDQMIEIIRYCKST